MARKEYSGDESVAYTSAGWSTLTSYRERCKRLEKVLVMK